MMEPLFKQSLVDRLQGISYQISTLHADILRVEPESSALDDLVAANESVARAQAQVSSTGESVPFQEMA